QDSNSGNVPAPSLNENLQYNHVHQGGDGSTITDHEYWSLVMQSGYTVLNLIAMNTSNSNPRNLNGVFYQQNVQYLIDNSNIIALLSLNAITFTIGGQVATTNLTESAGFTLAYSPMQYNGTIPWFNCNITFHQVQVYPGTARDSTFELTMIHYVTVNWTQSVVKTEALFNFTNTKLFDASGTELPAGAPFAVALVFNMGLTNATDWTGFQPSSYTNTTLEYNIMQPNGQPISIAKLNMESNFTAYNASGAVDQAGYSNMTCSGGGGATVTQGFPNLLYGQISSLQSDPEITFTYDRLSSNPVPAYFWPVTIAAISGAGVVTVLLVRRHKQRAASPIATAPTE
ncbi:MAG TPA: hypothetical protein VKK79_12650, partial [Candidatus Lokiarchaeia archaeon]|nr:hypothetical protein [Candidatus Lokiarchaeia archaeon]